MADSWVSEYLDSWDGDDERRGQDAQKADHVRAGSNDFFKAFWERVEADVSEFKIARSDLEIMSYFRPSSSFVVTRRKFPFFELDVKVEHGEISYTLATKPDSASDEEKITQLFRLDSDLAGNLQVKRNGEYFKDYAELSKTILKPVFEYLRRNR